MTIDTSKWDKVSFGDVARCLTVATKDPLSEGLERYVGLEHIEPGNIHIKSWGEVAKGTTFTRVFRKGQVLFGKRRAYQKKAALAEFDGICSGDILVCEAIEGKLIPELLPFVVQSDRFFDFAIKTSAGSLSPRTKFKDLAKFSLKLPSRLEDQKRIADLLWSIDGLEEKYLKTYYAMDAMMKRYAKEMASNTSHPMMKIGDVATVTSGNSAPQGSNYFNGDKPFVRVQHFSEVDLIVNQHDLINDKAISDYRLKLFPKDSIVFTKSGASAYLEKKAKLKTPSYVVSHLGVIIADQSQIMPDYLFYIFRGLNISKNCVSDYPTIDLADIKRWEIPVPGMDIQKSLVDRFSAIIANYDRLKAVQHSLFEVKKQIINQMFG